MSDPINSALPERHSLDKQIADLSRKVERLERQNGQLLDDAMRLKDDACKATEELLTVSEALLKLQHRARELGLDLRGVRTFGGALALLDEYADVFAAGSNDRP